MIFINEHSLSIVIPKHTSIISGKFKLELVHQSTQTKFEFCDLGDLSEKSKLYLFQLDFSNLLDGTYNYYLYADDELIEEGLLVFGDFESEVKEYQKNNSMISYNG